MGPRKFLHHGVLRKSKSGKELVTFLLNDFILLTLPNKMIGSGHQFSFDKHSDIKLKLYRKVGQLAYNICGSYILPYFCSNCSILCRSLFQMGQIPASFVYFRPILIAVQV